MAGHKLADALEQRVRRHGPEKCEELVKAFEIELSLDQAGSENGLDLRGERKSLTRLRVKQRLYSGAVANQRQFFFDIIPHGEREHTVETSEAPNIPLAKCI